jgi:hypothetical protein
MVLTVEALEVFRLPPLPSPPTATLRSPLGGGLARPDLAMLGDSAVLDCGPTLPGREPGPQGRPWGWLLPRLETVPPVAVTALLAGGIKVGRDAGQCGLVLQQHMFQSAGLKEGLLEFGQTSRVHFEIIHRGGSSYIVDRSTCGTFLQKTALVKDQETRLRSRDRIGLLNPAFSPFTYLDAAAYDYYSPAPVGVTARYLVGQEVGRGSFSTVRKAWARDGLQPVAIKLIKNRLYEFAFDPEARRRELEVMGRLEHPGVARLLDHCESVTELAIVMEFCPGGELGRAVRRDREAGMLDEGTAAFQFYQVIWLDMLEMHVMQVVQAVTYLHQHGVCHRDIKASNILLIEPLNSRCLICAS